MPVIKKEKHHTMRGKKDYAFVKSCIEELDAMAYEYIEKFWYEQPKEIKAKMHMAFRAGYVTASKQS